MPKSVMCSLLIQMVVISFLSATSTMVLAIYLPKGNASATVIKNIKIIPSISEFIGIELMKLFKLLNKLKIFPKN